MRVKARRPSSNEDWKRIEICGVSDSGQFAAALWQFHLSDPSGRAGELGIILRDGGTVSIWSKNRIIAEADEDSTSDTQGEKESKEAQIELKKDNPQEGNDKNFEIFHCVFANASLCNQPEISLLLHTGASLLGTAGVILVFRAPAVIFFRNRTVRLFLGTTTFVAICAKFGNFPNQ